MPEKWILSLRSTATLLHHYTLSPPPLRCFASFASVSAASFVFFVIHFYYFLTFEYFHFYCTFDSDLLDSVFVDFIITVSALNNCSSSQNGANLVCPCLQCVPVVLFHYLPITTSALIATVWSLIFIYPVTVSVYLFYTTLLTLVVLLSAAIYHRPLSASSTIPSFQVAVLSVKWYKAQQKLVKSEVSRATGAFSAFI